MESYDTYFDKYGQVRFATHQQLMAGRTTIRSEEGNPTMTKYYRVLKDTPRWIKDAVLERPTYEKNYEAVDPVFQQFELEDGNNTLAEGYKIIEAPENKEFFQRVWPLEDGKFGTRLEAQKLALKRTVEGAIKKKS